jgi:hypothetical protein
VNGVERIGGAREREVRSEKCEVRSEKGLLGEWVEVGSGLLGEGG